MDFNQTIQLILNACFNSLSFILNHFLEFVLLAMLIYVIASWGKIKALWHVIYDKVDKQMDAPFKKVEMLLKVDREQVK